MWFWQATCLLDFWTSRRPECFGHTWPCCILQYHHLLHAWVWNNVAFDLNVVAHLIKYRCLALRGTLHPHFLVTVTWSLLASVPSSCHDDWCTTRHLSPNDSFQDAEKRQTTEIKRGESARKADLAALGANHQADMASANDALNHQPGDANGLGDWAPGMRSSAFKQLAEEQQQARQTARLAEATDADDSWSH
jgi:hypothetical protein